MRAYRDGAYIVGNSIGYSDLSEVGKGRGGMGKRRYTCKECVSHGVVLGVKHRERVCAVRKGIIKYSREFQFWNLTGIQILLQWRE